MKKIIGGPITWPWRPTNLLGRTLIVEVLLTMDTAGSTKLDITNIDPSTPVEPVVKALASGAGALMLKAEEYAKQAGLDIKAMLG